MRFVAIEVYMTSRKKGIIGFLMFGAMLIQGLALSQSPQIPPKPPVSGPPPPPGVEPRPQPGPPVIKKLGENLVQINSIIVDTAKKEVTVDGRAQSDRTLEFIASAKQGVKLYESAIELDTDATTFNFALIMIGLDKSHGVAPRAHFDAQAAGDPVEIWVEWGSGESRRRVRIEELIYDEKAGRVPQMGEWVYTGSTVLPDGRFLAEMDGVLIGFVHDPASLIENTMGSGINAYGTIKLNPNLKLAPDTELKLTVRALPKPKKPDSF
jgi:hypothetical protein